MDNEVAKLSKVFELTPEELIQKAIDSGEGVIAKNGALSVETGDRTGRSPNDRFIVKEPVQKILLIGVRLINLSILINLKSYGKRLTLILQRKTGIFLVFMLAHMTNITYLLR